ncbi:MAG: hypothetical protein LC800_06845, partial [Acidobacteria bacterium]|nr:hypothetical protein [Acidobacteriota bacterium]
QHRFSRDFTFNTLHDALAEVIACFPVYRSYVRRRHTSVGPADRAHILRAVRAAKRRNASLSESIFDFVASVLLLEDAKGLGSQERAGRRDFVLRFQQLTSPVTAKGLEDTTFYRYYPLASLNEVGGEPDHFGVPVEEFHRFNLARRESWPHSMSATSTHDSKRGEDVRARLNVLSEIPEEWGRAVSRWRELNRAHRRGREGGGGAEAPDGNEEYLLYQTLAGAWPLEELDEAGRAEFVGRIQEYIRKALREAKVHTSWINANDEYERAVADFVRAVLTPSEGNRFLADFAEFHRPVARAGMLNSLSQTLLKIAAPGVPDFYQGTELWGLTLRPPGRRARQALRDEPRARAPPRPPRAVPRRRLPAARRARLARGERRRLRAPARRRRGRRRRRALLHAARLGGASIAAARARRLGRHVPRARGRSDGVALPRRVHRRGDRHGGRRGRQRPQTGRRAQQLTSGFVGASVMDSKSESAGSLDFRNVVRLSHFFEHGELLSLDYWLFIPDNVEEVTAATLCLPVPSDVEDWAWTSEKGWKEFLSSHDIADVIEGLRTQKAACSEDELVAAVNYFWKNDAFIEVTNRDGGRE